MTYIDRKNHRRDSRDIISIHTCVCVSLSLWRWMGWECACRGLAGWVKLSRCPGVPVTVVMRDGWPRICPPAAVAFELSQEVTGAAPGCSGLKVNVARVRSGSAGIKVHVGSDQDHRAVTAHRFRPLPTDQFHGLRLFLLPRAATSLALIATVRQVLLAGSRRCRRPHLSRFHGR